MDPVFNKEFSKSCFRLGNFVFMMRKCQISSATMNINCFSKQSIDHSRAFYVPAWSSLSPWAVPHRLARFGPLPQDEIKRIALPFIHVHAGPCLHILEPTAREFTVVLEGLYCKKHIASSLVRMAA